MSGLAGDQFEAAHQRTQTSGAGELAFGEIADDFTFLECADDLADGFEGLIAADQHRAKDAGEPIDHARIGVAVVRSRFETKGLVLDQGLVVVEGSIEILRGLHIGLVEIASEARAVGEQMPDLDLLGDLLGEEVGEPVGDVVGPTFQNNPLALI